MDFTEIKQYVFTHTSARRYAHCLSTAKETQRLMQRYASQCYDPDSAYMVGLWHDVTRDWSDENLLLYCIKHNIAMEAEEYRHPMLLHGAVAAHVLTHYRTNVPECWTLAIRWHTIGSVTMGILGAALFVADYLEPLRTHLAPGEYQTLWCNDTLEEICLAVVQKHLAHLQERGKSSAGTTIELATYLGEGGVFT